MLPVHVDVSKVPELLSKLRGEDGMAAGREISQRILHSKTTFFGTKIVIYL